MRLFFFSFISNHSYIRNRRQWSNILVLYYTSFSIYCKGGSELCRWESEFVKMEEIRFESLCIFSKNLI